jgi:hypothetical protein
MNLKIIDNFYEENDFSFMLSSSMLNTYSITWQPNCDNFYNRTNAYPCHETKYFKKATSGVFGQFLPHALFA